MGKSIYIHETHTLHTSNGELYMHYGELRDGHDSVLVFNIDTLYRDLPSIIKLCVEEKKKNDKILAEELQNTLRDL